MLAPADSRVGARGPLLLMSGGQDHIVPPAVVRSARKQYRRSGAVTELREFPDRGHSLTIDSGWHGLANSGHIDRDDSSRRRRIFRRVD